MGKKPHHGRAFLGGPLAAVLLAYTASSSVHAQTAPEVPEPAAPEPAISEPATSEAVPQTATPIQPILSITGGEPPATAADPSLLEQSTRSGDQTLFLDPVFEETASPAEKRRKWRASVELELLAYYDTNIFTSDQDEKEDFVFEFTPKFLLEVGDFRKHELTFLEVSYLPTARFFLDRDDQNSFDQDFRGEAQWTLTRTKLAGLVTYKDTSGGNVDVGDRTRTRTLGLESTGQYLATERTNLNLGIRFYNYDYETRSDAVEGSGVAWIDHLFRPTFSLGLQGVVGVLEPGDFDTQKYEQALLRFMVNPAGKVRLSGTLGADFRQTKSEDRVTPVWNVATRYQWGSKTTLTLDLRRNVNGSVSDARYNYIETSAVLRLANQLTPRFTVGLDGGYSHLSYRPADAEGIVTELSGRKDDYFFVRPSLDYKFNERFAGGLFYFLRFNDSNRETYDLVASQVGFRVSVTF